MDARKLLLNDLLSVGFDPQRLRVEAVLEFLLNAELFCLDDFEGATFIDWVAHVAASPPPVALCGRRPPNTQHAACWWPDAC